MLTPPGGDETGRLSLARAGRHKRSCSGTRVASRAASRAEFRRSRGTEGSNPSPSAAESVSAGSRGCWRQSRGCGAGLGLVRDVRRGRAGYDQTSFGLVSLTGIDAVPLQQSSTRSQRRGGRGGAAACGIPPGCAAQLASSLRCSVQSNGRSSSVRRVAVSATGCRPCKIASTSSGLKKARPTSRRM
jgi:hypothetical protein